MENVQHNAVEPQPFWNKGLVKALVALGLIGVFLLLVISGTMPARLH